MTHVFDGSRKKGSNADDLAIPFCDASMMRRRNTVLEQVCQSLESESGLGRCIHNVIASHPGRKGRTKKKGSSHFHENGRKYGSKCKPALDGFKNAANTSLGMSAGERDHNAVTERCCSSFSDIITSQQFAQLSSLLLENFQGMDANKLFGLNLINLRMKDRAYDSSPLLFHSDIQQLWTKLQKIGTDITTLAKHLSQITTISFQEQVDEYHKHEVLSEESDTDAKSEPIDNLVLHKGHPCMHCTEKMDETNCLVCDSCEETYHASCLDPPVQETPSDSWFCADCSTNGIGSLNDKPEESLNELFSKIRSKKSTSGKKRVKEKGSGIRRKWKDKCSEEIPERESKKIALEENITTYEKNLAARAFAITN